MDNIISPTCFYYKQHKLHERKMHQANLSNLCNDMASLVGQSQNHCRALSTVSKVGVILTSWQIQNKFRDFFPCLLSQFIPLKVYFKKLCGPRLLNLNMYFCLERHEHVMAWSNMKSQCFVLLRRSGEGDRQIAFNK